MNSISIHQSIDEPQHYFLNFVCHWELGVGTDNVIIQIVNTLDEEFGLIYKGIIFLLTDNCTGQLYR